ncbi:MAG: DegV family protein [uncultured Acidimicrobiales bacterium]|uniref:DegV family protein n=1 Tax=uncultured Acidimicrobiales bacterium TaxID=310071 RepID=A0A6J4IZG0_9ACTN|nr:MAG: DegV family protein [uncultured Acidimicrobiales bacterium]
MTTVRIVTDSACDIPPALADANGIIVVPLTVRFGEEEFVDRRDLSPEEFWSRVASSPVLPETAAPSPGAFEAAYREAAAAGAPGVVAVLLSADLSATYQAAELAARAVADVVPVRVIDSRSLTSGEGSIALAAARAAAEGKSVDEVAEVASEMVGRTRVYAALDTLENLKKGGRIGGAQAMLGSMLSIKPIIELSTGKVEQESKQRTRTKSLRYLADKVKAYDRVENLSVMHGDAPDIEAFLEMLGAAGYDRDAILVGDIGAVIGAHAGPRVVGVTFQVPR